MATKIYDTGKVYTVDGIEIYLEPLKIKYLREFMDNFLKIKNLNTEEEKLDHLIFCAAIAMRQLYPKIKTSNDIEDNFDIDSIYKILDISAGIKIDNSKEEIEAKQELDTGKGSWEDFDLAKMESEVFLLGAWKDYDELESSISLPELSEILTAKRDSDYENRKFFAAIQGIDLDQNSNNSQDPWEAMKARVFSGGRTEDPNDIVSFQGIKAAQSGFGVGMGLDYEDLR